MTITTSKSADNELSINLGERFDFGSVDQFRKCYEELKQQNPKRLKVDFKNTRYMDSSALGMLINAKSHLGGNDIKITLANANQQIKKIFSISRFDTKFDIE